MKTYLVVGQYSDWDFSIYHVFGHNTDRAKATMYARKLQDNRDAYVAEIDRIRQLSHHSLPVQEKFEKLRDYHKRIAPLMAENEMRRQGLEDAQLKLLCTELFEFRDFYSLSSMEFNVVEIKEVG